MINRVRPPPCPCMLSLCPLSWSRKQCRRVRHIKYNFSVVWEVPVTSTKGREGASQTRRGGLPGGSGAYTTQVSQKKEGEREGKCIELAPHHISQIEPLPSLRKSRSAYFHSRYNPANGTSIAGGQEAIFPQQYRLTSLSPFSSFHDCPAFSL